MNETTKKEQKSERQTERNSKSQTKQTKHFQRGREREKRNHRAGCTGIDTTKQRTSPSQCQTVRRTPGTWTEPRFHAKTHQASPTLPSVCWKHHNSHPAHSRSHTPAKCVQSPNQQNMAHRRTAGAAEHGPRPRTAIPNRPTRAPHTSLQNEAGSVDCDGSSHCPRKHKRSMHS